MVEVIKCDHGDYVSLEIDHPYGIPRSLVSRCIEMHEKAFPGHKASITEWKG